MNSNSNTGSSAGLGFGGALQILFIGLKLAGIIDWPWLWVLCPLWGPIVLFIAGFLIYLPIHMLLAAIRDHKERKAAE